MPEAEAALAGATAARLQSHAAAAAAAAAIRPISDVRASERYRAAMAEVIARRAIDAALARARGGDVPVPASGSGRVKVAATLTVNGIAYPVELDPGTSLLAAVRDAVGLTGSKEGCDDSECGACMMLLDGKPVNCCSYLALQAEGSEMTTVEGLATGAELSPLQAAFLEHGGVQCGFCTPGHADLGDGAPRREPVADRRRGADRALRQPLPLHRLRRDRQGGARRRRFVPIRLTRRRSGRSRRRERALDALDDLRPRQAAQRDRRPPAQHVVGGLRPIRR